MSTHSREIGATSCVFGLLVLGLSYLAALEQGVILSAFRTYRDQHPLIHLPVIREPDPTLSSSRALQSRGRWRAHGAYLLNESGTPVRLNGINWSGFETFTKAPGGLDHQDYKSILDAIQRAGFNVVRIPFSNEMLEHPSVPPSIAFNLHGVVINQDLKQLNSLEIMDKIVEYSGEVGLRVILDNHRSTAGGGPQENGLWFTTEYPETSWIDDWLTLARRYRHQPAVVALDLRNEPHSIKGGGACWSCGGEKDWHSAAERVGNFILAEDPSMLVIVEGVDVYGGDASWWGGNLEGVRNEPVRLSLPDHVIYSAHEYGPEEHSQPWLNSRTTLASLRRLWDRRWGYIEEQGIAPVYVGEFGTPLSDAPAKSLAGSQTQWFAAFIDYLQSRPHVGWSYWSANAEDRYSFFESDYVEERPYDSPLLRLIASEKESSSSPPAQSTGCRMYNSRSSDALVMEGLGDHTIAGEVVQWKKGDVDLNQQSYLAASILEATRNAVSTLPQRPANK